MGEKEKNHSNELPNSHKVVLSLIGEGSDNPTTVKQIINTTGYSDYRVRNIISDLIVTYKKPIGSSSHYRKHGYFIIATDEDREMALRQLKSRARKILKRASVIEKIPSEKQMRLI